MQPKPKKNKQKHIADLVIKDIKDRKKVGIEHYGMPLQPFNGRDALQDAYEELLDLAQYIKQVLVEQETQRVTLDDFCDSLMKEIKNK